MKILTRFFELTKNAKEAFASDRRIAKRYELLLKLSYSDLTTKSRSEVLTTNISRSGLRFPSTAKIPKGTILDLRVEDPYGNAPVSLKGKVVWAKEFVTGDDAEDVICEAGVELIKKSIY